MRHETIRCQGANGVTLIADAYGEPGDPHVLLLHGGGQTRHSWGGSAEALAKEGFYAVSADTRGHGESDWDPFGDYSLDAMRGDVEAWCELLERPALVGASLGGMASIWTEGGHANEGLEPVSRALVLVDIAHRTEPTGVSRIHEFMNGSPDGFASIEEAAEAVAAYQPHRPRPKSYDGLAKNLRLRDDGRYHWHWDPAFIRGMNTPRSVQHATVFEQYTSLLTIPVLLVRGRQSDVVSEEIAHEFLALCPHAKYVDVRDAHHMVAGDRNDAFTGPVVEFLRGL